MISHRLWFSKYPSVLTILPNATSASPPDHLPSTDPCSRRGGSSALPTLTCPGQNWYTETLRAGTVGIAWKSKGGASGHQQFSVLFNSTVS